MVVLLVEWKCLLTVEGVYRSTVGTRKKRQGGRLKKTLSSSFLFVLGSAVFFPGAGVVDDLVIPGGGKGVEGASNTGVGFAFAGEGVEVVADFLEGFGVAEEATVAWATTRASPAIVGRVLDGVLEDELVDSGESHPDVVNGKADETGGVFVVNERGGVGELFLEVEEGAIVAGDPLAKVVPGLVCIEWDAVEGAIFVEGDGEDAMSSGRHCSPLG